MAQTGDMVRFLNSVGGGRIVRIEDNIAYVDEDGFETPVLLKECVVVAPAQPKAGAQYIIEKTMQLEKLRCINRILHRNRRFQLKLTVTLECDILEQHSA